MMSLDLAPKVRELAGSIGDFIRYWGFRRIHGEVWTLIFLAEAPLSGAEIVNLLGVSKALVSPALKELEDEGLIKRAPSENEKVKRYTAVEDVVGVIQGVLRRREEPMLERVWQNYQALSMRLGVSGCREDRFRRLGEMIQMAQIGLHTLIEFDELFNDGTKSS